MKLTMKNYKEVLTAEGFVQKRLENGKKVLAYGEVTGHHHAIKAEFSQKDGIELFEKGETMYMVLETTTEVPVEHDEHSTITFEPGIYETHIQTEYDPEGDRRVLD